MYMVTSLRNASSYHHFRQFGTLSVASWNVNGLRSLLRHDEKLLHINKLIYDNQVDVLCLQETKLQSSHTSDIEDAFRKLVPNVKQLFWSCSQARKGYSGTMTAILSDKANYELKHTLIGEEEGDLEGRTIVVESDKAIIVNNYTPNAGTALKRLDYRVNTWDIKMSSYIQRLSIEHPDKLVLLLGDLNVCYDKLDYCNYLSSQSKRMAGTTPQEQISFKKNILGDANMIDTFRLKYPNDRVYSYFSPRKGETGRQNNEGWRLDYVMATSANHHQTIPDKVISSFIMDKLCHPYSDHCPVGTTFQL